MTVYIDKSYKVHTTPAENRVAIETDVFNGMTAPVIECYIFVPKDRSYTKPNGTTVHGEFIQPWATGKQMDAAQRLYDLALITEYESALSEIETALGVAT